MKNRYEIRGEVTAIFIESPKHGTFETHISTSDLERVKEFKNSWYIKRDKKSRTSYAVSKTTNSEGRTNLLPLHRLITDAPKNLVVDHIDHNGLNNVSSNLRVVTQTKNQQNRGGAQSNSRTGVRGVSFNKLQNKYVVKVTINGKQCTTGYFDNLKDAEESAIKLRSIYYN